MVTVIGLRAGFLFVPFVMTKLNRMTDQTEYLNIKLYQEVWDCCKDEAWLKQLVFASHGLVTLTPILLAVGFCGRR